MDTLAPCSATTHKLRVHPGRYILMLIIVVWIVYMASNFRSPLSPILLSDSNSGSAFRQLIFGSAGLCAGALLFFTSNIGAVFAHNFRLFVFAGFIGASVLWSGEPSISAKRIILFFLCLTAIVCVVHSSRRPVSLMLHLIVGSTAAIALISLALYFVFPKEFSVNPARPGLAGISIHPNTLAPFLSIGFLLSLGLSPEHPYARLARRIAQGILLFALILTVSMTTLLTTAVGFGLYTFFSASNYRRGLIQLSIIASLILGSLIGWSNLRNAAFDTTGRDASLSGRDELWAIVWNEGQKNPVFGQGFGAFWTEGKGRELVQTWNPRQSHNAYLDLWLDLGLIGLVGMIFCFHLQFILRWPSLKSDSGTAQRRAISALCATALSYCTIYALAQSFFLRFDSFHFLVFIWSLLLITNSDENRIELEFTEEKVAA